MKTKKNLTTRSKIKIFIIFLLVMIGSGIQLMASSLIKYVAHSKGMLSGSILISDSKGVYWDNKLPSGWKWVSSSQKPGKYYMSLGKISPSIKNNQIFFKVSRWNFINSALQDGFTEPYIIKKINTIRGIQGLNFKEDTHLSEAYLEFEKISKKDLEELFKEPKINIDFSLTSNGIVIFKSTLGKWIKMFVENYSTSCLVTAMEIPQTAGLKTAHKKQKHIKNLEYKWELDFDDDGLTDISWNPISHVRSSSFGIRRGYKIALYKIYKK